MISYYGIMYMVSIYIYIIIICIYNICVQPAKTANETRSCEGLSAEVCARTSGSTGEWTPDISTVGLGQNHALNTTRAPLLASSDGLGIIKLLEVQQWIAQVQDLWS